MCKRGTWLQSLSMGGLGERVNDSSRFTWYTLWFQASLGYQVKPSLKNFSVGKMDQQVKIHATEA